MPQIRAQRAFQDAGGSAYERHAPDDGQLTEHPLSFACRIERTSPDHHAGSRRNRNQAVREPERQPDPGLHVQQRVIRMAVTDRQFVEPAFRRDSQPRGRRAGGHEGCLGGDREIPAGRIGKLQIPVQIRKSPDPVDAPRGPCRFSAVDPAHPPGCERTQTFILFLGQARQVTEP